MPDLVDPSDFKKLDIRVGTVKEAERVRGSERLILLKVDFGNYTRQSLAGMGHIYMPEEFVGKQYVFLVNLRPKKIMGHVSECMMLAAVESEDSVVPVVPSRKVKEGTQVI